MNGINYSAPLNQATNFSQNVFMSNLPTLLKEITVIALVIFAIGAVCAAIGYFCTSPRIQPERVNPPAGTVNRPANTVNRPANTVNRTDERIQSVSIVVQSIAGQKLNISATLDTTIGQVMRYVAESLHESYNVQRLLFRGINLDPNRTLRDYDITENSTLRQVSRLGGPDERMQIIVKSISGQTLNIPVSPDTTIDHVMQSVAENLDQQYAFQRLIFGNRNLEKHRTLRDYGITANSTLHQVMNI